MKIYVAGPITGMKNLNRAKFFSVEKRLLEMGHGVVNPARLFQGVPGAHDHAAYMRVCLPALIECHAVFWLAGWHKSTGANFEAHTARALNMVCFYDTEAKPLPAIDAWMPAHEEKDPWGLSGVTRCGLAVDPTWSITDDKATCFDCLSGWARHGRQRMVVQGGDRGAQKTVVHLAVLE